MEFLTEDPTYLAGGLGILAAVFLVALRLTQQGKFLIWACAALAAAGVVLLVEWLWVTDTERIEQVVYDLRTAVANSNAPAVLALLTDDVQYGQSNSIVISGASARAFIESQLERVQFDFVRITHLEARASSQTRRGRAEFRVMASGSYHETSATFNFGTINLDFSLGFREVSPRVWKAERISLTRPPRNMPMPRGLPPRRPRSVGKRPIQPD